MTGMSHPAPPLPEYRYHRLSHLKSLRLLKLFHGSETTPDINCELFEVVPGRKTPYEALSWTWGNREPKDWIRVSQDDKAYRFSVPHNLASALRALRQEDASRVLWIDAICIDQKDPDEKNHQIPMMAQIYGEASRVCVWLGDPSDDSKLALKFIKENVLDLWTFDRLCENKEMTRHWAALLRLIMRPWFSRRWVVQEIALANEGLIYCGRETISWRKFADAVSLFVEVETATHRLSEIMKRDEIFNHIPNFFEDVAALSATLLIEATNNLFRRSQDGGKERLSSLEDLVSSLSVFKATEPRDTIYALLAIAKDTSPTAADRTQSGLPALHELIALGRNTASKPYNVDYKLPYIDICKDFVEFSIRQSTDQTRALDMICRPWAPEVDPEYRDDANGAQPNGENQSNAMRGQPNGQILKNATGARPESPIRDNANGAQPQGADVQHLPSWIQSTSGAAFKVHETPLGEKMGRMNADPLVGLPNSGQRNYSAAGTKILNKTKLKLAKRSTYYRMHVEGFVLDSVGKVEEIGRSGNIPLTWAKAGGWLNFDKDPPEEFWRTVVANRGPGGRNPQTFYPTACREAFKKGMRGDTLEAAELINNGRCSIVAQFLRRVQAVVWNRKLVRTVPRWQGTPGRLGLVPKLAQEGDLVCILYGCTVPVILREFPKSGDDVERETKEEERAVMADAATKILQAFRAGKLRRTERERRRATFREQRSSEPKLAPDVKEPIPEVTESLLERCRTRAELSINHYQVEAMRIMENCRLYAMRIIREYQLYAGSVLPVAVFVYLYFRHEVERDVMLLYASMGITILFAIFPRSLLPRLWSSMAIKYFALLSLINPPPPEAEPDEKAVEPIAVTVDPEYYKLIGECYIHGMMDNEAIRFQNENGIKPRMFELR